MALVSSPRRRDERRHFAVGISIFQRTTPLPGQSFPADISRRDMLLAASRKAAYA